MNFLNRINNWGKRHFGWLVVIMFVGFLMWLFAPPSNLNYIISANGNSYHCSRYEVDKLPLTNFSVDDKGAMSIVLTPSYNLRLYDWKPRHFFRVLVAEFNCKNYQINILTDHDPTKH
jgi:hypothetical protein